MSDQETVSEHYSLDTVREQIQPLSQAEASHGRAIADLRRDVEVARKAGDEGIKQLDERIENLKTTTSNQEKRIDLIADDDPYNPGELARIGERISTLEARLTNEVRQLRRDINVANDHRKTLSERVEGYHRNTNADNEQLEKWTRDQFQGVSDALDAFRDWGQEHTTSDGEWHATLSKQLTGAKIVLAAGGIAISYLMGRSTR